MAIISSRQETSVVKRVEKRETFILLVAMWIGTFIMKNRMKLPQKAENKTTIMIQQLCFWVYSQRKWNQYLEELYELPCSLHYLQKSGYRNNLCCPMNEWLKKMWLRYRYLYLNKRYGDLYTEECFSVLKKGNLIICEFVTTWVNVEDITVRETRQSKKDK